MLRSAVEEYLLVIGELGPKPLGPPDEDANQKMEEIFSRKIRANDMLVVVATSLLVLSGICNLLIILWRNPLSSINAPVSSALLALQVAMLRLLYQWWKDKSVMDILIFLSQQIPAKEMAKIIISFRSNGFKSGPRKVTNRKAKAAQDLK